MSPNEVEILLVEDSPHDIELTLRELRRHHLANCVHVVRDGQEALDCLFCRGAYSERANYSPKLVLLDLKLPKVDGLQVLREIRADERTTMVPMVVLSSSKEQQDVVNSYRLHVNSYIQKPVEFEPFRRRSKTWGITGWCSMYRRLPRLPHKA